MNKKAQYQPQQSYSSISPIFILGIVIFIMPFFLPVFGFKDVPSIVSTICYGLGMLGILIGGALSIFSASN